MNRQANLLPTTLTHTKIVAFAAALALCLPAARAQVVTLHEAIRLPQ